MDLTALTEALERARLTGDRAAMAEAFQQLETDELPAEPGEMRRFRIRGASPESYSTLFAAAEQPPPTFPPDVPWIPGVQVGVSRHGASQTVAHWYGVDTVAALARILDESHAEGWVEPPGLELPTAPEAQVRVLERPGFRRQIIVNAAEDARMLLLVQMAVPGSDTGT
jgi:hypothetical protein